VLGNQGEKTMMLSILTFYHVVFALIAIVSGVVVLFGLLTQELLQEWAVHFLRSSLAASITGLLFPFHQLPPTHWNSMLSVYLSGAAILAWRKFQLAGVWSSVFAMSTSIVLYLNVLAVMIQVFKHMPSLIVLAPTLSESRFLVMELVVMIPFAMYGIVAAKRFRYEPLPSSLTIKVTSQNGGSARSASPEAHKDNEPGRSTAFESQRRRAVRNVHGRAVGPADHRGY
jgi:hypothetical protein